MASETKDYRVHIDEGPFKEQSLLYRRKLARDRARKPVAGESEGLRRRGGAIYEKRPDKAADQVAYSDR